MDNSEAKVIDLQAFRTRRTLVGERKTGVQQAFKPTSMAPTSSSPGTMRVNEADLSTRIERIKSSISRINQLMVELRSMSSDDKTGQKSPL